MKNIAINVVNTSVNLGKSLVLKHINLQITKAQWTSVVGPNGAGKSTLLKVLAGLLPYSGQVQLLGQNVAQWPPRQRAQQLAWLGQSEGGADDLTAYDVTMLGRLPHQGWFAAPSAVDHACVEQSLKMTQAWDWRDRPLGQLSGGERQRVLLARLLAVQAQVLLMDEPLANLDPPHQTDWLHTVRSLTHRGITVVSVLHEVSVALQADSMLIMAAGQVLHHGSSAQRSTHQALEAVFDHCISVHNVKGVQVALPNMGPKVENLSGYSLGRPESINK
jgi:iron complex transport system ATP-binding protein